MEIYGVTGMPLAGKTTVAEMMGEKGFTVLDMGNIVRIEMERRDIPAERTGEFVSQMRDEHGRDAIAQISVPYLEEMMEERDRIVITGMRGWSEKKHFEKETGEDIEVVAVWASRETRKNRKEERQREEDVEGQEFHDRDLREIEQGVGKMMALSDHLVRNEGKTVEELEEEVEKIV
ncbi:MAG: AAA family ATPase [Candidatus Nanohaloarchaea archaeon]